MDDFKPVTPAELLAWNANRVKHEQEKQDWLKQHQDKLTRMLVENMVDIGNRILSQAMKNVEIFQSPKRSSPNIIAFETVRFDILVFEDVYNFMRECGALVSETFAKTTDWECFEILTETVDSEKLNNYDVRQLTESEYYLDKLLNGYVWSKDGIRNDIMLKLGFTFVYYTKV